MDHDHLIGQVQHRNPSLLAGRGGGRRPGDAPNTLKDASARAHVKTSLPNYPTASATTKTHKAIDRRRTGEPFGLDEFLERSSMPTRDI